MATRKSRREFLKTGAAATAGVMVSRGGRALSAVAASVSGRTALDQFNYADVQLLDGPMLEQFKQNHALFLNLNEDSLLKPFRQLAGQAAPGEDMGGWYSPSPAFDPPKNMTGYIPGHSFGQYLSGLARAYAVTGDQATQAKIHRLVTGLCGDDHAQVLSGLLHSLLYVRQDELRFDRRAPVCRRS